MSRDRDNLRDASDGGGAGHDGSGPSPGKTTRTAQLGEREPVHPPGSSRGGDAAGYVFYPPPAGAGGAPSDPGRTDDPFGVHLDAREVAPLVPSGGEPLPGSMRPALEAAAGGDLGDVKVHRGADAAAASAAEGAHAFTYGNNIVLGGGSGGGGPDVGELLAHESAHVVQQRGAAPHVQRKSRDGGGDGPGENAADRSADRYRTAAEAGGQNVDAKHYFRAYLPTHIAPAISEALRARRFALPRGRVHWTERGREAFAYEVAAKIEEVFGDAPDRGLPSILAPTNLWDLVDKNRLLTEQTGSGIADAFFGDKPVPNALKGEALGPMRWVPDVATAIRSRLEERVIAALPKVVARYLAVQDQHQLLARATGGEVAPPAAHEIIPGHPIERAIIRALCQDDMVRVDEEKDHDDAPAKEAAPARKPRAVRSLHWLTEPGMWNWVKVDPADATAEEVAHHLWKDYSAANRLTASAPFFAIRVEDAVAFPQARMNRARLEGGNVFDRFAAADETAEVALARAEVDRDLAFDPNAQLAQSSISSEAATAQAARLDESPDPGSRSERVATPPAPTAPANDRQQAFAPVLMQLQALARLVAPLGLDGELAGVLGRTEARHAQLTTAPVETAAQLGSLARLQHRILLEIGAPLAQVVSQSQRSRGAADTKASPPGPAATGAAAGLIRAAAHSDLPETARVELAEALARQRLVATDAMEAMLTDAVSRVELLTMDRGEVRGEMKRSESVMDGGLYGRQRALREQVAELRTRFLAGDTVAPSEVERVFVQVDALRFEADVLTNLNSMRGVFDTINTMLKSDWVLLAGQGMDLHNVKEGGRKLRDELRIAHQSWMQAFVDLEAGWSQGGSKVAQDSAAFAAARLDPVKARLHRLAADGDIRAYLQTAYDEIDDANTRAIVVQIGVYIGVTLVASEIGGAVAVATNAARGAEASALGGQVVGALAQSTIVAGFGAATSDQRGDSFSNLFLSDVLGTMVTLGALGVVGEGIKRSHMGRVLAGLEDASAKARLGYKSLDIAARTITAGTAQVGAMHLDSEIRTGRTMTSGELVDNGEMGIAMMLTHGVINRLRMRRPDHLSRLGAKGEELIRRHAELEAAAVAAADSPNPEMARKLLAQERALYELEALKLRRKIDEIGPGDVKLEALAADTASHLDEVTGSQGAEIITSLGLEPLVPGHSYAGTGAEIDMAAARLEAVGFVGRAETAPDGRRIELQTPDGSSSIELIERAMAPHERPTARIAAVADPDEAPAHLRTTANMEAVADPTAHVSAGAETALLGPPNIPDAHAPTQVVKGPTYEQAMVEVRGVYAQGFGEGERVRRVRGTQVEGQFNWTYGHDSQLARDGTVKVVFRVHLRPASSSVTAADLAQLRSQVQLGIDRHYNDPLVQLPDAQGRRRLHMDVQFVDDPAVAHITVRVHSGNGDARVNDWFVGGNPTTHAHEITHGAFGILDEYHDPSGRAPDRASPDAPGVHYDASLMGDYFVGDAQRDNLVDPATGLRDRHLAEIGRQVTGEASTAPGMAKREHRGTEFNAMLDFFTSASRKGIPPPGTAPAPSPGLVPQRLRQRLRAQAAQELASVSVTESRSARGHRLVYMTSDRDAERMLGLFTLIEDVQVREHPRGFTAQHGSDAWYFERSSFAREPGSEPAHAREAGAHFGLPSPNTAVVEFYGFRGLQFVGGHHWKELPPPRRAIIEQFFALDHLLHFGHVGISFDGGKTIYGLLPPLGGDANHTPEQIAAKVANHEPVPGIVGIDNQHFETAEMMVRDHGWDTRVTVASQLIDVDTKEKLLAEAQGLSLNNEKHDLKYGWPAREPDAHGEYYPDGRTRNCATFPEMLGMCVPERSGELRNYIPALKRWADDGPIDLRRDGEEP